VRSNSNRFSPLPCHRQLHNLADHLRVRQAMLARGHGEVLPAGEPRGSGSPQSHGLSVLAAKSDARCAEPIDSANMAQTDLEPAARAHIPVGEMWAPSQQPRLTVGRRVGW
jgi:hypothetical protein